MSKSYPLDLSAIIHLASMSKNHSSSYRFAVNLSEKVNADILQQAFNKVAPRFPTIVAGIRTGFYIYQVVPVKQAPLVQKDCELIKTFSKEEIQECAMRVLYDEYKISIECFHALTDGYGAITFLKTLIAEYFYLLKGIPVETEQMLLDVREDVAETETVDDYYTYAKKGKKGKNKNSSYQIHRNSKNVHCVNSHVCAFKIQTLLAATRRYEVSLNVYLTAIMLMTIADMQREYSGNMPVQVMVPMNLRKLFPSKTLRNFILVAYSGFEKNEKNHTFEEVLLLVKQQLNEQMQKESLQAAMAGYTALEQNCILRWVPLSVKTWAVKLGHYFFGLKKSCITMTNLGPIVFPEAICSYIKDVHVFLTPREASGYNCGIITCGEECYINFTRLCEKPELEDRFVTMLEKYM